VKDRRGSLPKMAAALVIAVTAIGFFAVRCNGLGSSPEGNKTKNSGTQSRTGNAISVAPVQVFVSKRVDGSYIRYSYRVANGSAFPIKGLTIGYDRATGKAGLNVLPAGWSEDSGTPVGSYLAPTGWTFETTPSEEDSVGMDDWTTTDDSRAILGGQSSSDFSVLLQEADPPYETGSWTVYTGAGDTPFYSGVLQYENPTGVSSGTSLDGDTGVHASPNPTSGGGRITFSLPSRLLYEVAIFDARGRLVRNLKQGVSSGGKVMLGWDGRDDRGRATASGVYFVRVKTGNNGQRFARFVISR
jgi:hypothetical protein